jgi:hypothetical protein
VGLELLLALEWRQLSAQPVRLVACGVLGATILTHAVFFGAGRYAMVVYPWVAAVAAVALAGADAWRGLNISGPSRYERW